MVPTHDERGPRRPPRSARVAGAALSTLFVAAACTSSTAQPVSKGPGTPVPPARLATIPSTAAPGATTAPATGPNAVAIDNFNFTPATLTVPTGTTVTWTNRDDVPHTVTTTDKTLASPTIDTDKQFSFTFSTPGTYSYFCSIHPFMTGKVIVQ